MITVPDGFDISLLFGDLFSLSLPFVDIGFVIACGFLIVNIFKTIDFN